MKKKGFTLVELLAVIVILAIIALIATPLILNVIDNAKKGASENSALGYIEGIEKYIVLNEVTKEKDFSFEKGQGYNYEEIKNIIEIKGDKPTAGWVCIGDKKEVTTAELKINNYVIKYEDNKATVIDGEIGKADCTTKKIVCKRAETLHTETCTQTDKNYYCSGAGYTADGKKGTTTITYGNLGTTGTLTSGDAFDCDVNGDGTYDATTERFYYVSDLDSDSNIAVLIYYNNVTGESPDNATTYAYNVESFENNMGPVTAALQLPTTTQWSNVSLSITSRQITNETGTTTTTAGDIATFDYSNYAARLLTVQEVNTACGITVGLGINGELDSCNYLMENTKYSDSTLGTYGYWLETPCLSNSYSVWNVGGNIRNVNYNLAYLSSNIGVRPAIEVLKSEISY